MLQNQTLQFYFTFIALFLFSFANGQSLSGNVSSIATSNELGYANVDIYDGDDLVASVLADKDGNFNVKLDTGTYRAEIIYAGYKKVTKEIKITNDEKVDFGLNEDEKSKYKPKSPPAKDREYEDTDDYDGTSAIESYDMAEEPVMDEAIGYSPEIVKTRGGRPTIRSKKAMSTESYGFSTMSAGKPIAPGDYRVEQGEAGKLTAGEINDFSKWNLWSDLKEDELKTHKMTWNFSPEQRYMLQVIDQKGLPLADLHVHLTTKNGERLFSARTDNTGKAELWKSLLLDNNTDGNKLNIEVIQNGVMHTIKKAKPFDKGLNTLELTADCNQSQKVDIAFVVDATGSMSDELNYLTAELNDVMFKSKEISTTLNFSFANVFYRDHSDAYLTRKQDFTRVLSESVSFISEQSAGGGGDFEEAVEVALDTAVNTLSWSKDARARIIFLILDAPPHNTPEIQEKLNRISLQAAEKGIRIVPLVASGINKGTEYLMRSIALATNGTYAFLTDDSGIGGTHLKPSTDSYKVESLNDLLVRVIKSYTYMPDCDTQIPELNLNYPDSSVTYTPDSASIDSTVVTVPVEPTEISWSFYPNPTRDFVTIRANVAIPELYISDLSGKVLQVLKDLKPENPVKADLRGYASGIYLIRYPVGKKWVSGKVVLIRD